MKMWARRYRDLGSLWTQTVCRLHAVFCDLVPGGFARSGHHVTPHAALPDHIVLPRLVGTRLGPAVRPSPADSNQSPHQCCKEREATARDP
jgi:hypothetical protein